VAEPAPLYARHQSQCALFTILRNLFYTQHRKNRREDAGGAAAAQLVVLPSQEHTATLGRVAIPLRKLPAAQREGLMLVGAQGMTYEAAAEVLGCQVGTVKSWGSPRVSTPARQSKA